MGLAVQLVLMTKMIMRIIILMLKIFRLVLVVRLNDDDGVDDDAPGLTGTAG